MTRRRDCGGSGLAGYAWDLHDIVASSLCTRGCASVGLLNCSLPTGWSGNMEGCGYACAPSTERQTFFKKLSVASGGVGGDIMVEMSPHRNGVKGTLIYE